MAGWIGMVLRGRRTLRQAARGKCSGGPVTAKIKKRRPLAAALPNRLASSDYSLPENIRQVGMSVMRPPGQIQQTLPNERIGLVGELSNVPRPLLVELVVQSNLTKNPAVGLPVITSPTQPSGRGPRGDGLRTQFVEPNTTPSYCNRENANGSGQ
jgi:hypothetical protein